MVILKKKDTKQELEELRRVVVDHVIQSYVNDETFKIANKVIDIIEKEIAKR